MQLLPVSQPLSHEGCWVIVLAFLCPVRAPTVPAAGLWCFSRAGLAAQVPLVTTDEAAGHADVSLGVVTGAAALVPGWVGGWAGGWVGGGVDDGGSEAVRQ
jgi:hypothetical protein